MEEEKGCFGSRMDDESFMEMLRSGEEEEDYVFSHESSLSSPSSSCCYSAASQMLWFGAREEDEAVALVHGKSTDSSLSSLSSSSPSISCSRSSSRFEKKEASACGGKGRTARLATAKKPKTETSAAPATIMVRKENLGERIMALQQLVSPFGKSDTASVLHEALGYIRFLHDQVQVLSSAYLQMQSLPSSATLHDGRRERNDLRSRGLCLVPVAYTEHVARGNGADLWSPAVGGSKCCSSSASSKQ